LEDLMEKRKRVVIVGAGFGGLAAAQALGSINAEVLLIDRSNHHLFQPLLYQVATAALSPGDVAVAARSIIGKTPNTTVLMDEVSDVDPEKRIVQTTRAGSIPYDYLVLATGADYSFFGRDEWAEYAPVLKTLADALRIRERLLAAMEEAERAQDEEAIKRLLTFVVIGGGPTGVEMAGAVAELTRTSLAGEFRRLAGREIRIVLVEAGQAILGAFSPEQSAYAAKALKALGVEVRFGKPVEIIDAEGVVVGGERIESANVLWCAGTQARPAAEWLGAEAARNKAIVVRPDCSVSVLHGYYPTESSL
jgi:NADH dehydrogenase